MLLSHSESENNLLNISWNQPHSLPTFQSSHRLPTHSHRLSIYFNPLISPATCSGPHCALRREGGREGTIKKGPNLNRSSGAFWNTWASLPLGHYSPGRTTSSPVSERIKILDRKNVEFPSKSYFLSTGNCRGERISSKLFKGSIWGPPSSQSLGLYYFDPMHHTYQIWSRNGCISHFDVRNTLLHCICTLSVA